MKKIFFSFMCLMGLSLPAMAEPIDGMLYGYKLGEVGSGVEQKKRDASILVKTLVPKNLYLPFKAEKVLIRVTPFSNIIVALDIFTEFTSYEEAIEHGKYYALILSSKYGGAPNLYGRKDLNPSSKHYMPDNVLYEGIFDRKYILRVKASESFSGRKPHTHIHFGYTPNSAAGEKWNKVIIEEAKTLKPSG